MAIPRHDEIQLPALRILSDGLPRRSRDMEELLAKEFNLTEEEVNQMYDSGSRPIFIDRINWALSYLNMAGVVSKPRRGVFQINSNGIEILSKPAKFREYIDRQIERADSIFKCNRVSPVID